MNIERLERDGEYLELARLYARRGELEKCLRYANLAGTLRFEVSKLAQDGTTSVVGVFGWGNDLLEHLDIGPICLVEPVRVPLLWDAHRARAFVVDCGAHVAPRTMALSSGVRDALHREFPPAPDAPIQSALARFTAAAGLAVCQRRRPPLPWEAEPHSGLNPVALHEKLERDFQRERLRLYLTTPDLTMLPPVNPPPARTR